MEKVCKELITSQDKNIVKTLDRPKAIFDSQKNILKIYTKRPLSLTTITLLLNDFGLEIIDESTYTLERVFIYALHIKEPIEGIEKSQKNLEAAIEEAISGKAPLQCMLYKLVLLENFSTQKLIYLRSMVKYLDQLLIQKREASIVQTFLKYHTLTNLFVNLFFERFGGENSKTTLKKIESALEGVKNYEDDKLLKIFFNTILSTKRTNFFLGKMAKSYRIDIASFKHLLGSIQPNIELFVYHPDFLGVHLRTSKISRGGIRWSSRDDFREEIKELMITQEAKNAIIVPTGAKGGFFIYEKPTFEEFKKIYTLYIDALLDLIDKTPNGEDFYFVVAADRGTAKMSDTANAIALQKGYWLKDAFASGGSQGYNHKKLGVTAKGAWLSAARHFDRRKIDIFKDPITVVGTGSMRGDVFGNGMLINPNIRLLGAISSKEIFIDPNPDPKIAYEERKRLFEEEKSWDGYDKNKISKGGGVFLRESSKIELSSEIQKLINYPHPTINGTELAKRILCLNVDLLYIGGIGTYVKSSEELNIHIADKINESVRVDANNLQAFAVCEGGNLGFTQAARIEYAKKGGGINLDSIDNSAGVDTSDHEVNLKIVLNQANIEGEKRKEILFQVVDEILKKVFFTNYLQPLAISLDQHRSAALPEEFIKVIELLEKEIEYFKRHHYAIPKNRDIEMVMDENGAFVRPVLGVLLSYAKIFLQNILLKSDLIDHPFYIHFIYKYFPRPFHLSFEKEITNHPLKREIIAMMIANIIINNAGISFLSDYEELGKERFLTKIEGYTLLLSLLGINKIKKELYTKEKELDSKTFYEHLLSIEEALAFNVRWAVRNEAMLEPFHILNYKTDIAHFLQLQDNRLENFLKNIDLVRFIYLAISLKEQRGSSIGEVLDLFKMILDTFKIETLLQVVLTTETKTTLRKELRHQLLELIESFVAIIAKDILFFARSKETPQESLKRYLNEKQIEPKVLATQIEKLAKTPHDLLSIIHTVHKLLLKVI